MVVAGDSPMMQSDSIGSFWPSSTARGRPACWAPAPRTTRAAWAASSATRDGRFCGIVEEKDATDEQKRIREVNLSCYVFNSPDLLDALDWIRPDNAQGEYYLTDCPGTCWPPGRDVRALNVLKPCEALSINNMDELAAVEAAMCELGIARGGP